MEGAQSLAEQVEWERAIRRIAVSKKPEKHSGALALAWREKKTTTKVERVGVCDTFTDGKGEPLL